MLRPMVTTPATPAAPANLSFEDLMTRGYFPDRAIPPVNALGIVAALADMRLHIAPIMSELLKKKSGTPRSRCITHSVPKRKHLRRSLSIPNPLHHFMVSDEIASNWKKLNSFCSQSPLSLSVPTVSTTRALVHRRDLNQMPVFRAQKSIGSRYLLRTDIARFYPSIYTHSIPWALHGKTAARADKKFVLLGNRLDLWTRETQDKQTGGIPIGPDTSFLIGELIGTALDLELIKKMPTLRGVRSVDDYYLYFNSVAAAESALATLHEIARKFELEINDPKTEIIELPDTLEPAWKSELRSLSIRPSGQPQVTDLLSLFDRAFERARLFPSDNVLTYAAKQVLGADITAENWQVCEALLLKAALSEPTMLSVLEDVYEKFAAYYTDSGPVTETLESICGYHAPLQQGNEVAWALWLAKKLGISISKTLGDKIARVDDDIVALVALDLIEEGLLQTSNLNLWRGFANSANLYEEHWLLAYEAQMHGWLSTDQKPDYVAADPFFSILQNHGVRFYGAEIAETESHYSYTDDDSGEDEADYYEDEPDEPGELAI